MSDQAILPSPPEGPPQKALITHSVLVGLTPLIPIPIVDDLVKSYLQRRLVIWLAQSHGRSLRPEEIEILSKDRGGGCLSGCLAQALVYPLKKLFRKIFFFLEWKRAVDLTSHTYHFGYLIDYALSERWEGATVLELRGAAEVRAAIDAVCCEAPIKPIESAVRASFRQSRNILKAAARMLEQRLRRTTGRLDQRQVAQVVESVEEQEEQQIKGVIATLQRAIGHIPDEHFRRLRMQLANRLVGSDK